MTHAERIGIQEVRERREEHAKWQALVESIARDGAALDRFRQLMLGYVGAPDLADREREGLPVISTTRYNEVVNYPEELCAMVSDRGDVLYARAIEPAYRWSESVQPDYDERKIFERGKDYFVVAGSLFSMDGPVQQPVARHTASTSDDGLYQYHRLQVVPPHGFSQPYLPIYGDMTFLPWQVSIDKTPDGSRVRYVGDDRGRAYRPIDGAFVDMIAVAAAQHADAPDRLAS